MRVPIPTLRKRRPQRKRTRTALFGAPGVLAVVGAGVWSMLKRRGSGDEQTTQKQKQRKRKKRGS